MNEPVIVLNELTKSYGKHRGIDNISFSVCQGEIFGLDCNREPARIAKDVGYLPSENCYYNNMKVKEMLLYTAELYGVDGHSRMEVLAERLNLDLFLPAPSPCSYVLVFSHNQSLLYILKITGRQKWIEVIYPPYLHRMDYFHPLLCYCLYFIYAELSPAVMR